MADQDQPLTAKTPVRFSDALPDAVDVVIIGGGVVGIFAALYLNRMGQSVLVCEKGRIAAEQSSRNWGWIRQQGRDPAELPIMTEALSLWYEIDDQLNGATGFRRNGVTYLASSERELEEMSSWMEVARDHRLDTRLLSESDVGKLIDRKGMVGAHRWIGGMITPSDARGEPWRAVPAVARLAHQEGVLIGENLAARGLDISAGDVRGVHTELGTVRAPQVVLAAGAWSSLFARRHGVELPQLTVHATAARTAQLPEVLSGNAADKTLAIRRRRDGGYTIAAGRSLQHHLGPDSLRHFMKYAPLALRKRSSIGFKLGPPQGHPDSWSTRRSWEPDELSPFERMRVLDPPPNQSAVARAQAAFAERFPGLGPPIILNAWGGVIDAMPDVVPIVDRVAGIGGLIVATGMSGHGFGIGPGFGKIVAEIAVAAPGKHDISRFRFSRFHDGSKLVPGPGF
ncbi:MAG: FAD-binding oxidoreductase [Hyphomicrobiales bacterium]|nr:FAD-binding oxidoreductase [Hyphomicrobiales bacterium]